MSEQKDTYLEQLKQSADWAGTYLSGDGSESAGLRRAASVFGARVFERYPSWEHEKGTDFAEARDVLTAALAAHPERKESDARSIQHWNNLRLLREAAQAVIDWEQEYRTLNHLGKNPPHPFVQLAIALAALAHPSSRDTEGE